MLSSPRSGSSRTGHRCTPVRPLAIKSQNRGGKGEKPGVRTKFGRVLPPPIELVNWDEIDGGKKNGDKPSDGVRLFEA